MNHKFHNIITIIIIYPWSLMRIIIYILNHCFFLKHENDYCELLVILVTWCVADG